jgi:hypothetical protein
LLNIQGGDQDDQGDSRAMGRNGTASSATDPLSSIATETAQAQAIVGDRSLATAAAAYQTVPPALRACY